MPCRHTSHASGRTRRAPNYRPLGRIGAGRALGAPREGAWPGELPRTRARGSTGPRMGRSTAEAVDRGACGPRSRWTLQGRRGPKEAIARRGQSRLRCHRQGWYDHSRCARSSLGHSRLLALGLAATRRALRGAGEWRGRARFGGPWRCSARSKPCAPTIPRTMW
jgi:hypothetical protein